MLYPACIELGLSSYLKGVSGLLTELDTEQIRSRYSEYPVSCALKLLSINENPCEADTLTQLSCHHPIQSQTFPAPVFLSDL